MASFDETFDVYMGKHIGCLDEKCLDEIFDKHDTDGNGFIDANELNDFISAIFCKKLSDDEIEEFKKQLLDKVDSNNDGKIDKHELRAVLPTEENFLAHFCRGGKNLCGVDFIKIWNHYDKNGNGSLQGSELDGFLKDLYLKTRPKTKQNDCFVKMIETLKNSLLRKYTKTGEEGLNKSDLFDLLQVEATCPNFEGKSSEEFEKIFSVYDKDNSGTIEGDELTKLLSDLLLDSEETVAGEIKDIVLLRLDTNKDNKVDKSELKKFLKIKD